MDEVKFSIKQDRNKSYEFFFEGDKYTENIKFIYDPTGRERRDKKPNDTFPSIVSNRTNEVITGDSPNEFLDAITHDIKNPTVYTLHIDCSKLSNTQKKPTHQLRVINLILHNVSENVYWKDVLNSYIKGVESVTYHDFEITRKLLFVHSKTENVNLHLNNRTEFANFIITLNAELNHIKSRGLKNLTLIIDPDDVPDMTDVQQENFHEIAALFHTHLETMRWDATRNNATKKMTGILLHYCFGSRCTIVRDWKVVGTPIPGTPMSPGLTAGPGTRGRKISNNIDKDLKSLRSFHETHNEFKVLLVHMFKYIKENNVRIKNSK